MKILSKRVVFSKDVNGSLIPEGYVDDGVEVPDDLHSALVPLLDPEDGTATVFVLNDTNRIPELRPQQITKALEDAPRKQALAKLTPKERALLKV